MRNVLLLIAISFSLLLSKSESIMATNLSIMHFLPPVICRAALNINVRNAAGKPIPHANLSLIQQGKIAVTDAQGKAMLNGICIGNDHLLISCVGYESKTIEIEIREENPFLLEVILLEDTLQTQTITISTQKKTSYQSNGGDILSIDKEQLYRTRAQGLGAVLNNQPGVYLLQTGPTIAKPIIRGMFGNRVSVVNNSVRVEGQQWGNEHAPEVDVFEAKEVKVVKGPQALEFGGDALGGLIVMEAAALSSITKSKIEANVSGATNGWGYATNLNGEHRIGTPLNLTVRAGITYKHSGNTSTARYLLENTGAREFNYNLALGAEGKNYTSELSFSAFNSKIGIFRGAHIGNLNDLMRAFNRPDSTFDASFNYAIRRPFQDIGHSIAKWKTRYFLRNGNELIFTLSFQNDYRGEWDLHRPRGAFATGTRPELEFKLRTFFYDLQYQHQAMNGWKGKIGAQYSTQANQTFGRILIPNFRLYTGALYINEEKALSERWVASIGFRSDYRWQQTFSIEEGVLQNPIFNFFGFSGASALQYSPASKAYSLKASLGTGWRAPQVAELFSDGVHHGTANYELGDKNLKPEQQYSAGLSLETDAQKRLSIQTNLYTNYNQNFIFLQPQFPTTRLTIRGVFPLLQYEQGNVLFRGFDGSIRYALNPQFKLEGIYSFIRTWNFTDDTYLILTPPDRFSLQLSYASRQLSKNPISYRIGITQVQEQTRFPANVDFAPPPPAYTLVNAGVETQITLFQYKGEAQIAYFSLQVSNALNTAYRDYLNRFRYFTLDPGRNISLHIRVPIGV